MQKHDWIIEVCEDLKQYARNHHLGHLVPGLEDAVNAARHDVLLNSSKAVHTPISDCAVLGSAVGICRHSRRSADGTTERVIVRSQ